MSVLSIPLVNLFARDTTPVAHLVILYNVLQLLGLVFLAIILFTAILSHNLRRSRSEAWFAFMVSWIIYAGSYVLIIGKQINGGPTAPHCLIQAALVYATPVLTAWSTLALIVQVYLSVSFSVSQHTVVDRKITLAFIIIPPVLAIAIFIEVIVLGLTNRNNVSRSISGMFCVLTDGPSVKVSSGFVVLACLGILVAEGMILTMVFRNWHALRDIQADRDSLDDTPKVPLSMILRISLFSLVPVIAIVISVTFSIFRSGVLGVEGTSQANMLPASIPLIAAIIFGTQKDIFKAWMFWKRDHPAPRRIDHPDWNFRIGIFTPVQDPEKKARNTA
ncbi:hypothetical protein C8J56DRAFT_1024454 [Mycena floridula]|nr:hypothetical protein C8J56DRAFT_1024454 [Mycena floridula]